MPTVNNNTPTLRFPEFKEEWELKKLGKIAKVSSGGTPSRAQSNYWNGNIPWVSTTLIDFNTILESNEFITNDGLANSSAKLFPKGTLLMAMYGQGKTRGKVAILGIEATTNQACGAIVPNNDKLNELFLFQNLAGRYDEIRDLSNQGGQENLSGEIIKNILITLPTLPEQQKIATFLSAVDEKLQALKQKKSLLEQYKKGVMQKIFSQELRFKDDNGNAFTDWEEKKLGEIGETYNGLTGKTKEHFGNGKPYIQYKQIFDDSKIDISRFELVEINSTEKQNKVLFGDIFFTVSSETPHEIGMSSVLLDEIEELYLNSFCFGYRANSLETLSPYFSKYLFRSELFRNEIIKLAQGSTRFNMSKIQLMKIAIKVPCHEEQIKIATFLSTIDDKVNQCQTQITNTEFWKKGLLQGMFI
jgi:type I restriction enzyme S subunit